MIKTFAAIGATAIALVAVPASAQDWSGLYIGVYGGGQTQSEEDGETVLFDTNLDGSFGDTVRTTAAVDAFAPGFCNGSPNSNNAAAGCSDDEDFFGEAGLRGGYDWQAGPWVFGVVGEYGVASVEDNVTAFSSTPANYAFQREVQNLAAARLRLGYAYGRFLPYVTAGYAVAEVEETFSTSNAANSFTAVQSIGSTSPSISGVGVETDADGFQVGAGVETHITDRLTIGVEYVYTDLEIDEPLIVRTGPGTAPATNPFLLVNAQGTNQRRSSDAMELHGFRVTAAVRF